MASSRSLLVAVLVTVLALAPHQCAHGKFLSRPRLLQAMAPAQARGGGVPAVSAPAAKAPGKTPALPLRWSCTHNRILGYETPWIVWNCRMVSPSPKPICVRFSCSNVDKGGCPKTGTGAGTNTIAVEACAWGLLGDGDASGVCIPRDPIFPKSNAGFGFTVDSRLPLNLKPLSIFYPDGPTCEAQGGL